MSSLLVNCNKLLNINPSFNVNLRDNCIKTYFTNSDYSLQQLIKKRNGNYCHPLSCSFSSSYPLLHEYIYLNKYNDLLNILSNDMSKWWDEINKQDCFLRTCLHEAVDNNLLNIVILLLEHGVNPNLIDNLGKTCLHYAAKHGNYEIIINLLHVMHKDTINAIDLSGNTCVHIAFKNNNVEIGLLLLEHVEFTKVTLYNNIDESPFYLIKNSCNYNKLQFSEIFKNLKEVHALQELVSNNKRKYLYKFLLKINNIKKSSIHQTFCKESFISILTNEVILHQNLLQLWIRTSIDFSIFENIFSIFKLSSDDYYNISKVLNNEKQSIFHVACKHGNIQLLQHFCDNISPKVIDILCTEKDIYHNSPILYAASNHYWDIFKLLSTFISPKNFLNSYYNSTGSNILKYAVSTAPLSIFSIFSNIFDTSIIIQHKIEFKKLKKSSATNMYISGLLALSIIYNRKDVFLECELSQESINSYEGEDHSSLKRPLISLAFDMKRWEILGLLLKHQPDLSICDCKNKTFLDRCIQNYNDENVSKLLPQILLNPYCEKTLGAYGDLIYFSLYIGGCKFVIDNLQPPFHITPYQCYNILMAEVERTGNLNTCKFLIEENQILWKDDDTSLLSICSYKLPMLIQNYERKQVSHIHIIIAEWLLENIDFSQDIKCIERFSYLGYWKQVYYALNVLHEKKYKISNSQLLSLTALCIINNQVGIFSMLFPKICNNWKKLLLIALRYGRVNIVSCILMMKGDIIQPELYDFGRSPYCECSQYYKTKSDFELYFQNNENNITKDILIIWNSWKQNYYKEYNFWQMCAIKGKLDILLKSINLVEKETSLIILENNLITFALQNQHFNMVFLLLKNLDEYYDNENCYPALMYVVRQTKIPDLLTLLLSKNALNNYFDLYDKSPLLYCIPNSTCNASSFWNMLSYSKEILQSVHGNKGQIIKLLKVPYNESIFSILFRYAPRNIPGLSNNISNTIEQYGIFLLQEYSNELKEAITDNNSLFTFEDLYEKLGVSNCIKKGYWNIFSLLISTMLFPSKGSVVVILNEIFNQILIQDREKEANILLYYNFPVSDLELWEISLNHLVLNPSLCKSFIEHGFNTTKLLLSPVIRLLKLADYIYIKNNYNIKYDNNNSYIEYMASYGSLDIWEYELQSNIKHIFSYINSKQQNVLMLASIYSNIPIVNSILSNYSPNNLYEFIIKKDINGNTPLHFACKNNCLTITQLLANKTNILQLNSKGNNPTFEAYCFGSTNVLYYLRNSFHSPLIMNYKEKNNLLEYNYGWFSTLMDINHENIETSNESCDYNSPTHLYNLDVNYIKAKIKSCILSIKYIFILCIRENKIETIKYLLKERKNELQDYIINRKQEDTIFLILAAKYKHYKITMMLYDFYMSIPCDSTNNLLQIADPRNGNTLLHYSAMNSWEKFAFCLVKFHSFSWNTQNKYKETAILLAIIIGKFKFIENKPKELQNIIKSPNPQEQNLLLYSIKRKIPSKEVLSKINIHNKNK